MESNFCGAYEKHLFQNNSTTWCEWSYMANNIMNRRNMLQVIVLYYIAFIYHTQGLKKLSFISEIMFCAVVTYRERFWKHTRQCRTVRNKKSDHSYGIPIHTHMMNEEKKELSEQNWKFVLWMNRWPSFKVSLPCAFNHNKTGQLWGLSHVKWFSVHILVVVCAIVRINGVNVWTSFH